MSHYIVEKRAENWFAIRDGEGALFATAPTLESANLICNTFNERKAVALASPIRGEFVRIDVAADVQPANVSSNPFAQFQAQLVAELCRIVVPKISVNPEPEEFEDVADYLLRVARIFDRLLKAVGEEVDRNSTIKVDLSVFTDAFFSAVDGMATFECDRMARTVREERDEIEGEVRRGDRGSDFADDIFKMVQTMNRAMYGV